MNDVAELNAGEGFVRSFQPTSEWWPEDQPGIGGVIFNLKLEDAAASIGHLRGYQRLEKVFERKAKLPTPSAAKMALVESSAFWLGNPLDVSLERVPVVYRAKALLARTGAYHAEESTAGNLLLIGSGKTVPEVFGLLMDIRIKNVASYQAAAGELIAELRKVTPGEVPEEEVRQRIAQRMLEINDHGLDLSVRKLEIDQQIVALEPDQEQIRAAQNIRWPPECGKLPIKYEPSTLQALLAGKLDADLPDTFSLITAFRTEPGIWSRATGSLADIVNASADPMDTFETISEAISRSQAVEKLLKNSQILNRVNQARKEVRQVLAGLVNRLDDNGQLLVTVGFGNISPSEMGDLIQRKIMFLLLDEAMRDYQMHPAGYDLDRLRESVPDWPWEVSAGLGDMNVIIGTKSRQTARRLNKD